MEGKTSKEFRQYIKDNKIIAKEGQGVTSKPYEPISDKNSRANDKRIRPQIQAREQHAKQTINMRRGRTISQKQQEENFIQNFNNNSIYPIAVM